MSRKRSLIPPAFRNKKRILTGASNHNDADDSGWQDGEESTLDESASEIPSDTKAAILYLKGLFPVEKFERRLPPVIFLHQIYSIVTNRTVVDKQLGDLRESGEVRLFKASTEANEFCLVMTQDYIAHVQHSVSGSSVNKLVLDKFLHSVLTHCRDVSVNRLTMMGEHGFRDDDITHLVKAGVLTVRDAGTWWLAVPSCGVFMKSFMRGRKAILTMVRKSKYKEILQKDLESRKLPKAAKLGILYHIHDIIGADLVESIPTTSGQLLRLRDG